MNNKLLLFALRVRFGGDHNGQVRAGAAGALFPRRINFESSTTLRPATKTSAIAGGDR